jgi:hypothetical protein
MFAIVAAVALQAAAKRIPNGHHRHRRGARACIHLLDAAPGD